MNENNRLRNVNISQTSGLSHRRFLFMILGILLFLPPLSFLPQFTGDTNFCGAYCPRMFFLWHNGGSINNYFMGFVRSYMGVLLVLSIIGVSFFFGRYWCSHICPIGGATELGSMILPKWLKIDYSHIPASPVRYGYFAVYILAPAIGLGALCCSYCNYATISRLVGAVFSQGDMTYFFRTAGLINLGLVIMLGFLAKGGRAYCNFFCPVGALDAISNRIGLKFGKRIRVNESKCNSCGTCAGVCPTWAIEMTDRVTIDHFSCISCRECEKVCGGAINYGKA